MSRAPENHEEHIRQLLAVNELQAERIKILVSENARLRQQVAALKNAEEDTEGAR